MSMATKSQFGQVLVDKNIITSEQLEIALQKHMEDGGRFGDVLLNLGFINEALGLDPVVRGYLNVRYVNLKTSSISADIIRRIPARIASFYKVIPVQYKNNTLTLATAQPLDVDIVDGIKLVLDSKVETILAREEDILEAIRKYYGVGAATIDQMMGAVRTEKKKASTVKNIEEIDSEASIGKFINQILLQAYKDRATDIHIEPFENALKVRYRVDGVLYDTQVPANIWHFKDSINSRIKIMSNLNIAEKRLPQDGRFKVKVGEVDLDLRISFLPTQHGESVVIRILSSKKLYSLTELGLSKKDLFLLDNVIKKPHGIIFVTGPTGSGKTTTLYSCLSRVNKEDRKIITIEDPIEYQIKGITQIQINPGIGFTFARGLRSMLRHDPDIMMVGEVRDRETAEIAIQIALTGHLIFSTLHTNDAASGVTRLIDMGIEPYLISSSVECFIAQRLVRLICPKCKKETQLTSEMIQDFGVASKELGDAKVFEGQGCEACNFTGFYGREAIYEFLFINDEIREMLTAQASAAQIKNKAVQLGMKNTSSKRVGKSKVGNNHAQ